MSKKDRQRPDPEALKDNPFAALAGLRKDLPAGEAPPPAKAPAAKEAPAGPRRAVVRFQRKGRGGKEVTLVEQLGLDEPALRDWLKDLKRALGCGGAVEGPTLVLQGDQRERLPAALEERGVSRISVS